MVGKIYYNIARQLGLLENSGLYNRANSTVFKVRGPKKAEAIIEASWALGLPRGIFRVFEKKHTASILKLLCKKVEGLHPKVILKGHSVYTFLFFDIGLVSMGMC